MGSRRSEVTNDSAMGLRDLKVLFDNAARHPRKPGDKNRIDAPSVTVEEFKELIDINT